MELHQLRYIVKLAETHNFSKAAEELYITQPTLSQQISRIEQELGVRLFERSTRNVSVTEVGSVCVEAAKKALSDVNEIFSAAEEYKIKQEQKLRIGLLATTINDEIAGIISSFCSEYPKVKINLQFGWSSELINMLKHNELDAVISVIGQQTINSPESLDIEILHKDILTVLISDKHPFAKKQYFQLSDLTGTKLFITDYSAAPNLEIISNMKNQALPLPELIKTQSISNAANMVAVNMGLCILSLHVAERTSLRPGIVFIPIKPDINTYIAFVTLKTDLNNPTLSKFKSYFLKKEHELGSNSLQL